MRYALHKSDTVINVIEAEAKFFDEADPAWKAATFDAFRLLKPGEVCEPGDLFDGSSYTRPAREPEPPSIEERLAAFEDRLLALERAR